jgi:lipoprotein NlpD
MPPYRVLASPGSESWRRLTIVILVVIVAGCASKTRAPVEDRAVPAPPRPSTAAPAPVPAAPSTAAPEADWRPSTYTVKRGDTLYQIALDHGLDYRELAALNNLENINLIRVGQVLQLKAPGEAGSVVSASGVITTPLKPAPVVTESKAPSATPASPAGPVSRNSDNYKSSPKAVKEPYSEQALRDVAKGPPPVPEVVAVAPAGVAPRAESRPEPPKAAAPDADDDENKLDWVWPAKGRIVGNFSETANLKGIDIAGTAGTPVVASAAGTVVYAGTGLRGYGKLIIIKHNKTFLSAYAHNREILVKEGQAVTRGQRIAEMGNTDTTDVKLHFEIRRLGKPMDPARFLPPA